MSMLFIPSIPWTDALSTITNLVSLRFSSIPTINLGLAWHVTVLILYWLVYFIVFILLLMLSDTERLKCARGGLCSADNLKTEKWADRLARIKAIMFETMLIPGIVTLSSILKCGTLNETDDTLYVVKMGQWQCYSPSHIVTLLVVLPLTCLISYYVFHYETSKSHLEDIFILMVSFKVLDLTYQVMSAGIISFYEQFAVVVILYAMLSSLGLFSVAVYYQPCLGFGRYLNIDYACSYAMIFWTSICSLISILPNEPVVGLPEILFFLGIFPVIYGARKITQYYAKKKDEELFESCKTFMDPLNTGQVTATKPHSRSNPISEPPSRTESSIVSKDTIITINPNPADESAELLKNRIDATKDALVLSLVPEYHKRMLELMCQNDGEIITKKILNNPKCDDEYKIMILKILTNIANMNNDLRGNIIHTPNMIDVLLKINKAKNSSLVAVTYPRAALGVLCNISVHPAIFDIMNKRTLIEITKNTESGIDYSLRLFAANIVLNLVSFKKKPNTTQPVSNKSTRIVPLVSTELVTDKPDEKSNQFTATESNDIQRKSLFSKSLSALKVPNSRIKLASVSPTATADNDIVSTDENLRETAKIKSKLNANNTVKTQAIPESKGKETQSRMKKKVRIVTPRRQSESNLKINVIQAKQSQMKPKNKPTVSRAKSLGINRSRKTRFTSLQFVISPMMSISETKENTKTNAPTLDEEKIDTDAKKIKEKPMKQVKNIRFANNKNNGCTSAEIKKWLMEDALFNKIWWLVTKSNDLKLVIAGLSIIFHIGNTVANVKKLACDSKWFDISEIQQLRDDCVNNSDTVKFCQTQQEKENVAQKCEKIMKKIAKSSGMRKSELLKSKLHKKETKHFGNDEPRASFVIKINQAKLRLQSLSDSVAKTTEVVNNTGTMVVNIDE